MIAIRKNFDYCQIYCRQCGKKAKYLLEENDNQNSIFYCLACIKWIFKSAEETDKENPNHA